MRHLLALCLVFLIASAHADTGRRFPHSQITREDWYTYLGEVRAKPDVEVFTPEGQPETTAYFVPSDQAVYYFTTSGPAHPAVLVAQLYEQNGKVRLQNFGYFAGSEQAFSVWFRGFNNLGPDIEERMKKSQQ